MLIIMDGPLIIWVQKDLMESILQEQVKGHLKECGISYVESNSPFTLAVKFKPVRTEVVPEPV